MKEISELQSRVIDQILEGKRMTEIAKDTGIYRSQLYRWLKNKSFSAELETRRAQLRKSASDKITGQVNSLVDKMLDLAENSTDNRVKYNAIKYLLDRCLGTPVTAGKLDDNAADDSNKNDTNNLKSELEEIKKLTVIK